MDIWYGGTFYLPSDFYKRQQGDVDLLRWDNFRLENRSQDQSGVTIRSDGRLTLLFKNLDTNEYTDLLTRVEPLPAATWHRIDVRQRLGADGEAINELWVDDRLASSSTTRNWAKRPATDLRIGLVATSDADQKSPLKLWFDQAYIARRPLNRADRGR